jgi:hypothetical protein
MAAYLVRFEAVQFGRKETESRAETEEERSANAMLDGSFDSIDD